MRGFVELSKQNGMDIIDKCLNVLKTYKGRYEPKTRWNMLRFGYETKMYEIDSPHWRGYERAIKLKLSDLYNMLDKPDPVHLSLECYNELIKLSKGDRDANPVFILNY